ncbi:MAG: hypothetical protein IPJ88_07455 [Myxococcales bacterium]|nr:MAG: hypothetical protein IPJ88_07455 [Myxococcales bacterium]
MSFKYHLALVLLLAGIAPIEASATTVISLDLQELVGSSNEIVIARVVSQRFLRSDNGRPLTETTLQIHESHKGSCKPREIVTVIQPGGVIDGIGMHVAGTTSFILGEEYLLFARSTARQDAPGILLSTVGMSQGAMRIRKDKHGKRSVLPSASVNTLKNNGRGKFTHSKRALVKPVALDQFMGRVQSYISSNR